MGVNLTPISVRTELPLAGLTGRTLAIDAAGELYRFLALIRQPDGTPLQDSRGHITSHLSGLLYRTTRLMADYGIRPAFVFDGRPPALKSLEIARRRAVKDRYVEEYREARAAGDAARAFSKVTMTSRLSREMIEDARRLLDQPRGAPAPGPSSSKETGPPQLRDVIQRRLFRRYVDARLSPVWDFRSPGTAVRGTGGLCRR